MAEPAQVGPYIANLELSQRRKENKQEMALGAFQALGNIGQIMFAYDESRKAENERQMRVLGEVAKMYGTDVPTPVMNAFGESVEKVTGRQVFLRDTAGNIVPPNPDTLLTPEEQQFKKTHPDKWNDYISMKLGMSMTPKEQAELDLHNKEFQETARHDRVEEMRAFAGVGVEEEKLKLAKREEFVSEKAERFKEKMELRTGGRKPTEDDELSDMTLGEDGWPRKAEKGENRLKKGEVKLWLQRNKDLLERDKNNLNAKIAKRKLRDDDKDLKQIMELSKISPKNLAAAGMDPKTYMSGLYKTSFTRLYMSRGMQPPTPPPGYLDNAAKLGAWMQGQLGQVFAADPPTLTPKPVPVTGAPMDPGASNSDLANKFLSSGGQ